MLSEGNNLGRLTPILTDFGDNKGDLLVVEYDVPQTNVKQTLFFKHGQLSIPKWALIPASILAFGLLSALLAIILNSILSQSTVTVTYSQTCSKTSKCKSGVGLTCNTQSVCACSTKQYWYENACVDQPTYTEQCNQTTECRTDLGLMCAEIDGQCNCPTTTKIRTCDCPSTSYWTGSACTARSSYLGSCNAADVSYQCISDLYCDGTKCTCAPNTQYWNVTANQCYSVDKYLSLCDPTTSYSCDASVSLFCLTAGLGAQCPFNVTANSTSCDCANQTYWNGGSCVSAKTVNSACFWNCECDTNGGLECLNSSCVCPKFYYWSSVSLTCLQQKNYTQSSCFNDSECDSTQGLICYLSGSQCNCPNSSSPNMCDCLTTQYYDYTLTSCQTLQLYNETCFGNYMCDSSLGLFCQTNVSTATNCSCPEPIRLDMCDCNMTSYWNGVTCVDRLTANVSCSFEYQCQAGFTCIVNETDIGIFSDVCRCPLGSYYVNGSGCVSSLNATQSCIGSYQCNELALLFCRYNATGLTCIDTSIPLPACDCQDNYFYNQTLGLCLARLSRFNVCDTDCECSSPYVCNPNHCDCANFYSSLNKTCVNYLQYGDQCSNTGDCEATPNAYMTCVNNTCACNSSGIWNGSQCSFTINFRAICTTNSNCIGGLVCTNIACIDSNKRCSCPSTTYFSQTNQTCVTCNGSLANSFTKYVINYPNSDLCVAVRDGSSAGSITFANADSYCDGFASMSASKTPQLISIHNTTELDCIARILLGVYNQKTCSNGNYYYLGYTRTNNTFYDGTTYSSVVSALTPCLTYCSSSAGVGKITQEVCASIPPVPYYGAICDFRVV